MTMTCIDVSVFYLHCDAGLFRRYWGAGNSQNVVSLRADIDEDGLHNAGDTAARFFKRISGDKHLLSLLPISLVWPLSYFKPLGSKGVLLLWTIPRVSTCRQRAAKDARGLQSFIREHALHAARLLQSSIDRLAALLDLMPREGQNEL